MTKRVQVLLSTYNGEKYLEEQLDSVLAQSYQNLSILVRDDGSMDSTKAILERYKKKYENIKVLLGKNKGVIASFFELLRQASEEVDYFAFCDQDDYWQADKLETALRRLKNIDESIPALYCGRVELVNERLEHIGMYPLRKRGPSFENAIVQNIATGCTIVMNKAARRLILSRLPQPENVVMHDWWFYLVVSAFGIVIYDPESKMLYRQHGANTVGTDHTFLGRWLTRFKRYVKKKEYGFITRQAQEFMTLYGEILNIEKKKTLSKFLESRKTLFRRTIYSFTGKVHRQTWSEDIICRIVLFLNMV
ncbi:glycosyltransferase family 2 protein [Aneurinibacillus thermoaerophilus]|nr:glycosyltransferase family 2 protein [Aneurinibacillus thermoaerophilus]